MIFDRTQNDVDTAILLRDTKVKKFETLTESEIATLEKGMLTINTLNRIETKQRRIKKSFYAMGYWNTPITNKTWGENDIFNEDEFQRILDNTNILRQAFFVYKDTPNTPPISAPETALSITCMASSPASVCFALRSSISSSSISSRRRIA